MHHLRHLVARLCQFEGRPHVGRLKNLHTLVLSPGDWIEEESLMELSALRNLEMYDLDGFLVQSHRTALSKTISKMVYLETLRLITRDDLPDFLPFTNHPRLHTLCLSGQLDRIPEFPPNLTKLQMSTKGLDQDPFPSLEKLRNLRMLDIIDHGSCVKKLISSAQGFPQLIHLVLTACVIEEGIVERGAMPAIQCLEIRHCSKLKMLPEGLRDLTSLQHLMIHPIRTSNKELFARVRSETGADWYKIQHIPRVSIL